MSSCDLLLSEVDKGIDALTSNISILSTKHNKSMGLLSSVVNTPIDIISDDANLLNSAVDDKAGEIISAIAKMDDDCGALTACVNGVINTVMDLANIKIPLIDSLSLPSTGLSKFTDMLTSFVDEVMAFGISSALGLLDNYFNCLSETDGVDLDDLQNKMDEVNGLLDSVGLDESGVVDMDKIYEGVSDDMRESCESSVDATTNAIDSVQETAKNTLPVSNNVLPFEYK